MQIDQLAKNQIINLRKRSSYFKVQPLFRVFIFCFFIGILTCAFVFPYSFGLPLFLLGFVNYLFLMLFRVKNTYFNKRVKTDKRATPDTLPSFSIIVPLKSESSVISGSFTSIRNLNYPLELLEILVVVEKTDKLTLDTIEGLCLPPSARVLLIPEQPPFTKGRALLHALKEAKNTYLTVYDAESRPEPDQLRKAAAELQSAEQPTVLQAIIDISNKNANWISRNFSGEYFEWYRGYLESLSALNMPFGLGGNSFFISREKLIECGAWDPFNVTEDADLAVRLAENGVKFKILNSTTRESCPEKPSEWINQRTRWNKGLFTTQLVHLHRFSLVKKFGFLGWLNFWLPMFSMSLIPLYNIYIPLFLILSGMPFFLFVFLSIALWTLAFFSAAVATLLNFYTYKKMGIKLSFFFILGDVIKYFALHLISGLNAYLEFFFKPLYWHKTKHFETDGCLEDSANHPSPTENKEKIFNA